MGLGQGSKMSEPCCEHPHEAAAEPAPGKRPMAGATRFLAWFFAFSGLYAMGAVCPFCGRAGCPTGAASAGVVGLVFASVMQWGRACKAALARRAHR
jgi:hypothetical protein